MKLKKKLMLLEDFETKTTQTTNNATEVRTEVKSGENIRTEVIADVDAILTNLETLSAQMSEGNVTLNESFEDLMKTIMSSVNYTQAKGMLKDFEKLSVAANQDLINSNTASKTETILKNKAKLTVQKAKAKGPEKEKITKQLNDLSDAEEQITQYVEKRKAKADDLLTAFNTKYSKLEGAVMGKLKELLAAEKAQITSNVKQAGLRAKAELAIKAGKEKRAQEAKAELAELEATRKAIEDRIKDGKDASSDEIAELKGMMPFMPEIEAFTKARAKVKEIEDEITGIAPQYNLGESLGFDQTFSILIETEILNLFTKAKGDEDKETAKKNLEAAKKLAAAVKTASGEEWKAKKALHDKVAAADKVTTKALITLAGGDAEKAQEVEGGYKLGELIPKWGGAEGFISAEEFGPIKKAVEVEDGVDQAITDAEEGNSNDGYNENAELDGSGRRVPLVNEDAIEDTIEDVKEEAIEDVKEEATKPKLYEGMSIAERFKALM